MNIFVQFGSNKLLPFHTFIYLKKGTLDEKTDPSLMLIFLSPLFGYTLI